MNTMTEDHPMEHDDEFEIEITPGGDCLRTEYEVVHLPPSFAAWADDYLHLRGVTGRAVWESKTSRGPFTGATGRGA